MFIFINKIEKMSPGTYIFYKRPKNEDGNDSMDKVVEDRYLNDSSSTQDALFGGINNLSR